MTASHGNFFFVTTSHSAENIGAPHASDTPHTHPPATVEALNTLTLLPLLDLFLGDGLTENSTSTLGIRRRGADTLFVDDVPHRTYDTAVGAGSGNNSLDISSIDGCRIDATTG